MTVERYTFDLNAGGVPFVIEYDGESVSLTVSDERVTLEPRNVTRLRLLLEMAEGPDSGPRAYRDRGEDA